MPRSNAVSPCYYRSQPQRGTKQRSRIDIGTIGLISHSCAQHGGSDAVVLVKIRINALDVFFNAYYCLIK